MTRPALIPAALLALPILAGTALADQTPDYYFGAKLGASFADDLEVAGSSLDLETGHAVGVILGHETAPVWALGHLRIEGELGLRSADLDRGQGGQDLYAGLLNLYHVFDLASMAAIKPFLGAAIGLAHLSLDDVRGTGGAVIVDDEAKAFAYGFMAGITYEAEPRIAVDLEYRFLASADASVDLKAAGGGGERDVSAEASEILAGIRFRF